MAIDPLSSLANAGTTTSIDKLVSMYMAVEQKPVNDLKARKGDLAVLSGVFTDLQGKLQGLKDLSDGLASSTNSVFSSHTVSSSDSTKVAATTSSSAVNGTYSIDVTQLASGQRVQSNSVASSWTTAAGGTVTVNGVAITVAAGASLSALRDAINGASYAAGQEVMATIVNVDATNSRLVLENKNTGSSATVTVSDPTGAVLGPAASGGVDLVDGSGNFLQPVLSPAQDAQFSVNGVAVTRSKNTGLSDVVSGLTIDLKDSTAGTAVKLTVAGDTTSMHSKIQSFLDGLNGLVDYLKTKSASTKGSDGNYTRGPLGGYTLYTSLESSLASDLLTQVTGGSAGSPQRLWDLGIQMDGSGHFVISDSAKLDGQLGSNPTGVQYFFGSSSGVAQLVSNRLAPYVDPVVVSQKSYVQQELDAISGQQTALDHRIDTLNGRLTQREATLRTQFIQLQSMMVAAYQQQQQLNSIFSATSGWTL
ncbi:MAG: flagellar filament capping protein FliD [Chloroflexi bacterium]|nr:flagellar filament capping protein FliD [Chloroflexota bacterium]